MTLPRVLLVCSALALAAPAPAHGQSGGADPISGIWTGDMAPFGSTQRQPITVELALAGGSLTGTVTGPPSPGVIRRGSFDPATGALAFEVDVQDGSSGTVFTFDGMAVTGAALGRVRNGGVTGDFRITKRAEGGGGAPDPAAASAAIRFGFGEVSGWVSRAAELVPAERWDYRPAPTVRTFGELVAHVADAYLYYCGRAAGEATDWSDAIAQGSTDKATVTRELSRAAASCAAPYERGENVAPLMANVAHANLHYGNMVTYLRMLGLVPPSS